MAYTYRNLAYDLSLFEEDYHEEIRGRAKKKEAKDDLKAADTSGEKISRKSKAKKTVKKVKRRKSNIGRILIAVVFGLAVVVTVVSIIHGQVQLTELNQQIINARDDLSEKQSLYTQLEMKVDSSISTAVVEQYAQDKLNMSKANNSQKEFISLSEGDKAEVSLDAHKNVFELIADAISSLWS